MVHSSGVTDVTKCPISRKNETAELIDKERMEFGCEKNVAANRLGFGSRDFTDRKDDSVFGS